jgi:hypothetical protein
MTSALSSERVDWIKDRIKVLSAMNTELIQRPAKYPVADPRAQPHVIATALHNIQSEKLQLLVELEVLAEYHKNKNATT